MIFSLAVKPGTIRRTFGGGDDDDDDDEDEEEIVSALARSAASEPGWCGRRVLGAGRHRARGPVPRAARRASCWATTKHSDLILWAGILGAARASSSASASISLWFERRPGAFLIAEIGRPLITLALMVPLLAAGGELEVAIAAAAVGNAARRRWWPSVAPARELRAQLRPGRGAGRSPQAGKRRVPIVASLWTVQNADVFILSRFVDNTDLGLYALASKIGPGRHLLPAGLPGGDAPAAEVARVQGGALAVRALDRRRADPRLLRPRLHQLDPGDGAARPAADRPGAAGVRRRGAR